MINISSIIIARDEEENIKRCIESLSGCIDEIIVFVDDRSTDGTFEAANSYPQVKASLIKWEGFAKTKLNALLQTSNDWIFWIDADEAFTKELKDEVARFKNINPTFNSYSVPRKANFLGRWIKHSGWYPGRVTRLFNKKFVTFNSNNVHEGLTDDGLTGVLNNDLEHYTDPSVFHYFIKFNNYTSLAAEDLLEKGKVFRLSDLLLRPCIIFFKMYLLKAGFLDGVQGFILAVFSSAYVFTKYSKFWELSRKEKK
jgi:glycosyltransferase involved in cell wall biosynthesis